MLRFPDGTRGESTLHGAEQEECFEQQKAPECGAGSHRASAGSQQQAQPLGIADKGTDLQHTEKQRGK